MHALAHPHHPKLFELLALYFLQLQKLLTNQWLSPWYQQHSLLHLADLEDMERGIDHEPNSLQDQIHLQHHQDQNSDQALIDRQHHNDERSQ